MSLPARPQLLRQTFTVTVTTTADTNPWDALSAALDDAPNITEAAVNDNGLGPEEVPGVNVPKLIELAAWVAGEDAKRILGLPSEWDQGHWLTRRPGVNSCGTACCIAGRVALDAGGVPFITRYDQQVDRDVPVPLSEAGGSRYGDVVQFPGSSRLVDVREFARDTLGLTEGQATELFAGSNRLGEILTVIKKLIQGAPGVAAAPTGRRRTSRYQPQCSRGEDCSVCYEDVPADEAAPASDVPF